MTATATQQQTEVHARIALWMERLEARELARREQVNAKHRGTYGRDLYTGTDGMTHFYRGKPGRKYTRIVGAWEGRDRSVHAFVDLATGDVYKAAGWKAPAAGVRYRLLDDASFALLLERCESTSGYLYANAR